MWAQRAAVDPGKDLSFSLNRLFSSLQRVTSWQTYTCHGISVDRWNADFKKTSNKELLDILRNKIEIHTVIQFDGF